LNIISVTQFKCPFDRKAVTRELISAGKRPLNIQKLTKSAALFPRVLVFLKQLKDGAQRFIRSALKDVNVELVKSHPAIQFSIET
jgi:hypothetical protein